MKARRSASPTKLNLLNASAECVYLSGCGRVAQIKAPFCSMGCIAALGFLFLSLLVGSQMVQ